MVHAPTQPSYAVRAPTRGGWTPITIHNLDSVIVRWWDANVQPEIDKLGTDRADRGWDWLKIFRYTSVFVNQKPRGLAIGLENVPARGLFLPCALMQFVSVFPALDDPAYDSVFIWFLADAPPASILCAGMLQPNEVPRMLGTICLDTAVAVSQALGFSGRVGLHADQLGGDRLFKWYQASGMRNLPSSQRIPGLRRNDGRYFYFDPVSAANFRRAHFDLRSAPISPTPRP